MFDMARKLQFAAGAAVGLVLFCVRGILLWFFLIPSLVAWVVGLALWPVAKVFRRNVAASPLFYSRWATALLDALLTRVLPFPNSDWPWRMDLRRERFPTWTGTFDGFGSSEP